MGRLLLACRSLPLLTVIVSPLLSSIACFVVKIVDFSSSLSVKLLQEYLGKGEVLKHETYAIVQSITSDTGKNWFVVDSSSPLFVVAVICSPSSMCFFSPPVVSRNYWVLSSDRLILLLSFRRNTAWWGRAVDKNSRPEKLIATQNCTNYDLIYLTHFWLNSRN